MLFGQSPTRYGLASLISACLAFASWPLLVVIGFVMVYIAMLLVLVAVISGLLGVGAGIYFKTWPAVATGAAGLGLIGIGVAWVVWSILNH